MLQTESEPAAREVLAARFQGICQPREPSVIERLPEDVDLLVASVMDAEMEGSWRESWSKDSVASRLKQCLRLMKRSPRVAWVLIEAPASLLESDGDESVPVVCDLVSEFERLGYRWAHRTIAAASFGVPDLKPRVFLLGSRHGDPRALLFAEDAGPPEVENGGAADGGDGSLNNTHDTPHAFVFNRRPASEGFSMRVYSDVAEGFHPSAGSCALTPDGALAPMEVHDAERMQGLPPGWTLTARPGSVTGRTTGVGSGNGLEADADRWLALASSLGCVPAARWIGAKLANPYASAYDASDAKAFEAAVVVPWPSAAFNAGDGRKGVASSPFPCEVSVLPTLGAFISGAAANAVNNRAGAAVVSKETALECADALRRAGWQPPPPLVAVEVAAHAELATAGAQAGGGEKRPANAMGAPANAALVGAPGAAGAAAPALPAAFGQMGALAGDPGSAAAAQAAALAALAPMMAAAAAAEQANLAAQANLSAEAAASLAAARGAGLPQHEEAPRAKKSKTSHGVSGDDDRRATKKKDSPNNAHSDRAKREKKDAGNPAVVTNDVAGDDDAAMAVDDDDDSYTVAGITLASRAESQVVWAKLPGHPFWPGLRVDLEPGARDVVPPETLAMRKEHEALVIFFGENSFGWVREDQVLDFKDAYAEKAREPIRNKARFNAALAEALRDVERRGDGFVPPAVHPRGRAGRHGREDHGHGGGAHKHHGGGGGSGGGSDKKEEAHKEKADAVAERGGDGVRARGGGKDKDEAVPSRLGHSGPGEGGVASSVPKKARGDKNAQDSKNDAAFEAKAAAASALAADATLAAPPESVPAGSDQSARAAMRAVAAAADTAVAAGRFATEGCACRCCKEPSSSSVCLRIEAQRMCGTYPVGAMLALQGAASVGNDIEIYWPLDDTHYVARVTSYDPRELQHMVTYEADGVREFLCLWKEDVKVLDGTEERNKQGVVEAPSAPRAAHAVAGDVTPAGGGEGDAAGDDASADDADAALLMGLQ